MDFGAMDTSNLIIKRIEMDGVKPIKDRHGFMPNGGNVGRLKQQKEHKKGHSQGNSAHEDNENPDSEHVLDTKVTGLSEEEHILDAKA